MTKSNVYFTNDGKKITDYRDYRDQRKKDFDFRKLGFYEEYISSEQSKTVALIEHNRENLISDTHEADTFVNIINFLYNHKINYTWDKSKQRNSNINVTLGKGKQAIIKSFADKIIVDVINCGKKRTIVIEHDTRPVIDLIKTDTYSYTFNFDKDTYVLKQLPGEDWKLYKNGMKTSYCRDSLATCFIYLEKKFRAIYKGE